MRKGPIIITASVAVLFLISMIFKTGGAPEGSSSLDAITEGFWLTFAAFLTLAILSFLYKDNPFYKFAEHLYVGVSAAYWMSLGFWTTLVANLFPRISMTLVKSWRHINGRSPADSRFVSLIFPTKSGQ